jgi:hypothetical protein
VRADAYLIVAAGRRLDAPTLDGLAEVAVRDRRGRPSQAPTRGEAGRWRPLRGRELERFLPALAGRLT